MWVIREMLIVKKDERKSERNKEENGRGRMDGQRVDKFFSIPTTDRVINRERFLGRKDLGSTYMILHHVVVCQQGELITNFLLFIACVLTIPSQFSLVLSLEVT